MAEIVDDKETGGIDEVGLPVRVKLWQLLVAVEL